MAWEHFDLPYHDGWSVSCALFTEVSDTKRLLDEARSGRLSNCCLLNAKRIMSPMQVGEMQFRAAFRDYFFHLIVLRRFWSQPTRPSTTKRRAT